MIAGGPAHAHQRERRALHHCLRRHGAPHQGTRLQRPSDARDNLLRQFGHTQYAHDARGQLVKITTSQQRSHLRGPSAARLQQDHLQSFR